MTTVALGLTLLSAYLVGAVPFGYLTARARGVDILRHGSGNIGATNVGRVLGRRYGILVFLLDFAKGALPTAAALLLGGRLDTALPPEAWGVTAGLAAFLGHLFPVYLGFRGGKGVATGAGVVAVLVPGPAAVAFVVWVAVVCASYTISLGSLAAAAALCLARLRMTPEPFAPGGRWLTGFCLVAAALVVVRHRANIARLARGHENRLKDSPTMLLLTKTIHVLALGLWFGGSFFFSFVAAPLLFQTFEALAGRPPAERPAWLAESFARADGTQLAGLAVGPMFPWFFLLQGACGLLAVGTSLPWSRLEPGRRVHGVRTLLLILAVAGVVVGWPLAMHVSELRAQRYVADAATAEAARAAFGTWHAVSLLLNLLTFALVAVAMALAAQLPAAARRPGGAPASPPAQP